MFTTMRKMLLDKFNFELETDGRYVDHDFMILIKHLNEVITFRLNFLSDNFYIGIYIKY